MGDSLTPMTPSTGRKPPRWRPRVVFYLCLALSALAVLTTSIALHVRAQSTMSIWTYAFGDPRTASAPHVGALIASDTLVLNYGTLRENSDARFHAGSNLDEFPVLPSWTNEVDTIARKSPGTKLWTAMGFGVMTTDDLGTNANYAHLTTIFAPFWFVHLAAALVILPSTLAAARLLRRRRHRACMRCGYALNGTPLCPECGTTAAETGPSEPTSSGRLN